MKYISKITISMALAAGLVANCSKSSDGNDGGAKILLMAQQVQRAATGSCALSVNHTGLYYGGIVTMAVTNGGSLSAIYTNAAVNTGSVTTFGQTQFEAASGKKITDLGYTTYASVPYNLKYDAFFTNSADGTTWTLTLRNAALAYTKTFYDYFKFTGYLAVSDTTNASASFPTGVGATAVSLAGTALVTGTPNPTNCNTFGTFATTCVASTATLASSLGIPNLANGTASLLCANIPRASCSFGSLTTASRSADISGQASVLTTILTTKECAQPNGDFPESMRRYLFKGLPAANFLPSTDSVAIAGYRNNTKTNAALSSIDTTTQILPYYAYPKFGSLVTLGFGVLMPVKEGATAYPTTSTTDTNFYKGSNLNITQVDSCDGIGLNVGPTSEMPQSISNGIATINMRKALTPAYEIAYSFSNNGKAAAAYAAIRGYSNATGTISLTGFTVDNSNTSEVNNSALVPGDTNGDTQACNASLRASYSVSPALGVTKMPVLRASAGDGGATQLLALCVYGGTSSTRTYAKTILAAGLGTANGVTLPSGNIPACGEGPLASFKTVQAAAAQKFGDTGLTKLSNFPDD